MSSSDIRVTRDQLVTAVLRYLSAERALNGPMPHASAGDELEYAEDMIDRAARELTEQHQAAEGARRVSAFRRRWKDVVADARGGDAPPPSAQGFA